ncbi:WGR domain-containing protein [Mariniluteicoccus flavus]
MADTTRLEFTEGSSAKFWKVTVDGATVTTTWGRLGTDGQTKVTTEAGPEAAAASAAKQIAAKEKKGYAAPGARPENADAGSTPPPEDPAEPAPTPPKKRRRTLDPSSDLAVLKKWWKNLSGTHFLALPPPTPSRYTQGHLHEDAAELAEFPPDTGYAGWHWQSHERSFDRDGRIISALYLHWGGDRSVVRDHLEQAPDGWVLSGGDSDDAAFVLDRETVLRPDGLPDPSDPASVRHLLERLDEPLDRRTPFFADPDPTPAETRWLKEFITVHDDLDTIAGVAGHPTRRRLLTIAELDGFVGRWLDSYADVPLDWEAGAETLINMLAVDHPRAWEVVDRAGRAADRVLIEFPSERSLEIVRAHALAGDAASLWPWLALQRSVAGGDALDAATVLYADLAAPANEPTPGNLRRLENALRSELMDESHAAPPFIPVAALRIATDERLPAPLRRAAAYDADDELPRAREAAQGRDDQMADIARRVTALFEEQRASLLAGSGPDLTQYEGGLADTFSQFRELSADQEAWLHAQVADPDTETQGLAYCLELLVAHGRGTAADLDALAPRWKKVLAKNYRTTYTEWRHPLVTLTALARDLDHPLRHDLEKWWQKSKAKWADDLRLLTLAGAPDEAAAAALWAHVAENDYVPAHWRTWMLVRSRLDGRRPVDAGAEAYADPPTRFTHEIVHALIATVDPAQPLWHYSFDPSSLGWLDRTFEVAEDATLPRGLRRSALENAEGHRLFAYPDQMRDVASEAGAAYADRLGRVRNELGAGG